MLLLSLLPADRYDLTITLPVSHPLSVCPFSLSISPHFSLYRFLTPLFPSLSLTPCPTVSPSVSLHFSPSISHLSPTLSLLSLHNCICSVVLTDHSHLSVSWVKKLLYKLTELEFPKPLPAFASILQFKRKGLQAANPLSAF